jgi:hypothetical protein
MQRHAFRPSDHRKADYRIRRTAVPVDGVFISFVAFDRWVVCARNFLARTDALAAIAKMKLKHKAIENIDSPPRKIR